MSALRKLALVIAASVGTTVGSAQASTSHDVGTISATGYQHTELYGAGSFADVFNFTVGAEYSSVLASAVGVSPTGVDAVSSLTLTIYAGSDATGSVMGTVSSDNGSAIDLGHVLAAGDYSVGLTGLVNSGLNGGYEFSIAAVPEPAEWMMLLAGLAVLGFIARRKTAGLMAG